MGCCNLMTSALSAAEWPFRRPTAARRVMPWLSKAVAWTQTSGSEEYKKTKNGDIWYTSIIICIYYIHVFCVYICICSNLYLYLYLCLYCDMYYTYTHNSICRICPHQPIHHWCSTYRLVFLHAHVHIPICQSYVPTDPLITQMVVPLGWGFLKNQPHVHLISGIYWFPIPF